MDNIKNYSYYIKQYEDIINKKCQEDETFCREMKENPIKAFEKNFNARIPKNLKIIEESPNQYKINLPQDEKEYEKQLEKELTCVCGGVSIYVDGSGAGGWGQGPAGYYTFSPSVISPSWNASSNDYKFSISSNGIPQVQISVDNGVHWGSPTSAISSVTLGYSGLLKAGSYNAVGIPQNDSDKKQQITSGDSADWLSPYTALAPYSPAYQGAAQTFQNGNWVPIFQYASSNSWMPTNQDVVNNENHFGMGSYLASDGNTVATNMNSTELINHSYDISNAAYFNPDFQSLFDSSWIIQGQNFQTGQTYSWAQIFTQITPHT